MITEKEKQNRSKLFRLMAENPDLPVAPMVDGEIPGDDGGYWLGAWGNSRVDEYLLVSNRDLVVFKSDDDVLERCLSDDMFEKLPGSKEECRPIYDALPWIKAIIVNIDLIE